MRPRFLVETGLAGATTAVLLTMPLWRNWIEIALGVDPDHHNGAVGWTIVFGALAVAIVSFVAARHEWRDARAVRA